MAKKRIKENTVNPFLEDTLFYGGMTVRQLVELVQTNEFPRGLDTKIRLGDVEGNLGIISHLMVTAHKPGDVVLSFDQYSGDMDYNAETAD